VYVQDANYERYAESRYDLDEPSTQVELQFKLMQEIEERRQMMALLQMAWLQKTEVVIGLTDFPQATSAGGTKRCKIIRVGLDQPKDAIGY
jgi:hypothetical protein